MDPLDVNQQPASLVDPWALIALISSLYSQAVTSSTAVNQKQQQLNALIEATKAKPA